MGWHASWHLKHKTFANTTGENTNSANKCFWGASWIGLHDSDQCCPSALKLGCLKSRFGWILTFHPCNLSAITSLYPKSFFTKNYTNWPNCNKLSPLWIIVWIINKSCCKCLTNMNVFVSGIHGIHSNWTQSEQKKRRRTVVLWSHNTWWLLLWAY